MPTQGIRAGRMALLAAALALCAAPPARAEDARERLELRSGERLEGRILAVTTRHVLIDVAGGPRFVDRSQVLRALGTDGATLDLARRESPKTRDVVGLIVAQFNQDRIRITRNGEDFEPSSIGDGASGRTADGRPGGGIANALIRVGDELRTNAWGKVSLVLPGDVRASARSDAVLRFTEEGPAYVRGDVRFEDGSLSLAIPEGRVTGRNLVLQLGRVRGGTQLHCIRDTARIEGEGFQLTLPKKHVVDVVQGDADRAPYVAANGANSFPIDLRIGTKWIQIQPGEKVCLVVIGGSREGSSGGTREPAPRPRWIDEEPRRPDPIPDEPKRDAARVPAAETEDERIARLKRELDEAMARRAGDERRDPEPRPASPAPESTGGIARARATAAFLLVRSPSQQWRITPEQAPNVAIRAGDEIATDEGRVTLGFEDGAAVVVNKESAIVVAPEGAGRDSLRLVRGEIGVSGAGRIPVLVPAGEITVEGESIVNLASGQTTIQSTRGRAALAVSRGDVRADVAEGARVTAVPSDSGTELRAEGTRSVPVRAGAIDADLGARRALVAGRTSDGAWSVKLWNNAQLEVEEPLRARVEERDGLLVASVSDGRLVTLEAGRTVRLRQQVEARPDPLRAGPDESKLRETTPPPSEPAPERSNRDVAQAPSRPSAPRLQRGTQELVLSNGAVVKLVNWGPLKERGSNADVVELEGPGGSPVFVGARTRLTLKRTRGQAMIVTDDERSLTWSEGPQTSAFTYRLATDGRLTLDVGSDRSLVVEPGASFEVDLRADGLVHAMIVGNSYYVAPGQRAIVTRAGLRESTREMAKVGGGK